MKKNYLLLPAIALLMASCSSEEPVGNDLQKPEYAAANGYMTINLRQATGTINGTKADDNPYVNGDGDYEDGTGAESNITRVRFYFFNKDGVPFAVRQDVVNNLYDNFIDWYPNSTEFGGPVHNETVEKTLTATLGLTFSDEDERPYQVLAVANPTNEILSYTNLPADLPANMSTSCMSLSDLQGIVANYLPTSEDDPFVMSNSVYVDEGEAVYTTVLKENNFQSTPAEAAKPENVAKIYIERVLSRVDFGITIPKADLTGVEGTFYSLGGYDLNDGTGTETDEDLVPEQVYVKFLGWNVTSTTTQSRLIKDIDAGWDEDLILGDDNPWYITQLHRSFWAINPNNVGFNFGNFGNAPGTDLTVTPSGQFANSLDIPASGEYTITYLQENANPYSDPQVAKAPASPSKVIIAAQLVGADGKPLTICEFQNVKYTLTGLKNQIAKQLNTLYYKTTTSDGSGWAQIGSNMITFTTTDPAGNLDGDKEYHVYAVLTTAAEGEEWAYSNDGKTFTPLTGNEEAEESATDAVNKYIRSKLTSIMIWNSGLTYYYFDIEHLGLDNEEIGFLGVVRNHIYRTTVTSVKGLGTPVYNPDLVIHPEKTENEETIIQFVIEPLSWRLVSSQYELNWE